MTTVDNAPVHVYTCGMEIPDPFPRAVGERELREARAQGIERGLVMAVEKLALLNHLGAALDLERWAKSRQKP